MIQRKASHTATIYLDSRDASYDVKTGSILFPLNHSYFNTTVLKIESLHLPGTHYHIDAGYNVLTFNFPDQAGVEVTVTLPKLVIQPTADGKLTTLAAIIDAGLQAAGVAIDSVTIILDIATGVLTFQLVGADTKFSVVRSKSSSKLLDMLGFHSALDSADPSSIVVGVDNVLSSYGFVNWNPFEYLTIACQFNTGSIASNWLKSGIAPRVMGRVPVTNPNTVQHYNKDYFSELHVNQSDLSELRLLLAYPDAAYHPNFRGAHFQLALRVWYNPNK